MSERFGDGNRISCRKNCTTPIIESVGFETLSGYYNKGGGQVPVKVTRCPQCDWTRYHGYDQNVIQKPSPGEKPSE